MAQVFNPELCERLESPDRKKIIAPQRILDSMEIKPDDIVLDIGAGIGYFTFPALEYIGKEGKIIAVDISETMIAEMEKRKPKDESRIKIMACSKEKIHLPDHSVDKILLAFVLHEVPNISAYLKELKRLLKKNGEICIIEWEKISPPPGPPLLERINYEDILSLLPNSGFILMKLEKINNFHYLCILKKIE